ncbi:uncharacterized protein LOC129761970 [Toxorhynchites rutilus septentrionalis]|uniref:uncharacterized protein LOC129761970 n=1 Tax=Toxorhynchites rutilus septentrionalis TaxID=329112 RepID=UPI002478654A|nr:uncharacterized protein LOC129761970 [Toxorhynchites rutilus septentrionalis]
MPPRSRKAAAKGKSSKKQNANVQESNRQPVVLLDIPRIAITSEIMNKPRRSRNLSRVDDSVIMLSSAETTAVELNVQEPSLMMLTAIEPDRPSTRLGHTDMTLEETGRLSALRNTRWYEVERTNTSDMNIDQTLANRSDMPKLSVAVRRTGSHPAQPMQEIVEPSTRPSRNRSRSQKYFSGEFITETRRAKTVQSRGKSAANGESNITKRSKNTSNINQPSAGTPERDVALPELRTCTRSTSRARKPAAQDTNRKRGQSKQKSVNNESINSNVTKEMLKGPHSVEVVNNKTEEQAKEIQSRENNMEIQTLDAGVSNVTKRNENFEANKNTRQDVQLIEETPNSKKTLSDSRSRTRSASRGRKPIAPQSIAKRGRSKQKSADNQSNEATLNDELQIVPSEVLSLGTVTTRRRRKSVSDECRNLSKQSTNSLYGSKNEVPSSVINNEYSEYEQIISVTTRRRRPVISQDTREESEIGEKDQTRNASLTQENCRASDDFAVPKVTVRRRNKLKTTSDSHISQSLITPPNECSSGEDLSEKLADTEQFSNVSKRRRPKPNPDKDVGNTGSSVAVSSNSENESLVQSSETTSPERPIEDITRRRALRSVSRVRQPVAPSETDQNGDTSMIMKRVRVKKKPLCACCSSEQHDVAQTVAPTNVPSQPRESRPRTRDPANVPRNTSTMSKSAIVVADAPTEPNSTSTVKSKARSRTRRNAAPKNKATRSKSELRSVQCNESLSRSQSVPKDANQSLHGENGPTGSHVPVYRKFTGTTTNLARSVSAKSLILLSPEPVMADGDIYAFDSPSQPVEATTKKAKKAAGTVKKQRTRSKSASQKRTSPSRKGHHNVFGTDMYRIGKVLRKIGGGPVRQKRDDVSAGGEGTMDTAQIVSIVQPPLQPHANTQKARTPSPASHHDYADAADDHHLYEVDDTANDAENIPTADMPLPVSSPPRINRQLHRVLQQTVPEANTPDKTQPNATLGFSPLGASSPWRVQDENVLPKTFYFSRSRDLLPSYESDVVARDDESRPRKSPTRESVPMAVAPALASKTPTKTRPNQPAPVTASNAEAVFRGIQKSYEQLKVTSEMSEKLISAMRSYKTNIRNQTASFCESTDDIREDQRLIAKFHEYEENMKKTYQKLKQWYERSQLALKHSIQSIEKVSTMPKTQSQKEVLDNFHRDSELFITMINELESAMNDSNIENISPPAKATSNKNKPVFRDIILSDRNIDNRNRSPLKALNIVNIPANLSPVKSPLVKASFTAFSTSGSKQQTSLSRSKDRLSKLSLVRPIQTPPPALEPSVIELADTFVEPDRQHVSESSATSIDSVAPVPTTKSNRDLFGFETDDTAEEEESLVAPTPAKITKETLKERLQSVRKLLPTRPPSRNGQTSAIPGRGTATQMPKIFNSPRRLRSVRNAFLSSTPMAEKKKQANRKNVEPDPNISAIAGEGEPEHSNNKDQNGRLEKEPSPANVVLFQEPEEVLFTSLTSVNRTYSRIPRRNHKRKRNIYLAGLGLSDDEEDDVEDDRESVVSLSEDDQQINAVRKRQAKKRRVAKNRKKATVEETTEFKNFVNDFNSMCEEVNRYQLVVEKPDVRQRV